MPAKTAKPATRRVRKSSKPAAKSSGADGSANDRSIAAVYTGLGHTEGRCVIGKCGATVSGANHQDARYRMAEHQQEAH